jgi:hypothetical protein
LLKVAIGGITVTKGDNKMFTRTLKKFGLIRAGSAIELEKENQVLRAEIESLLVTQRGLLIDISALKKRGAKKKIPRKSYTATLRLKEKILEILAVHPRGLATKKIRAILGTSVDGRPLNGTLYKMYMRGELARPRRGIYCLTEVKKDGDRM